MPTLHNQSKRALSWEMSGHAYACEAWGPVDVPEPLVEICKSYGLPLGPIAVPPEMRAQQRIADERQEAQDEALAGLRGQIEAAQSEAKAFAKELERATLDLQKARSQLRELKDEHARLKRDHEAALADKKAAEDLIAESARAATDAEERAIKAEARLHEKKTGAARK